MTIGLPWNTNRILGCRCPCPTCFEAMGYDPEAPCTYCPINHFQERPTKCSEIPDALVVRLSEAFLILESETGVVMALVAELGIPEKLARVKVERLIHRRFLEFGTSPYYAWPTHKGYELLEKTT